MSSPQREADKDQLALEDEILNQVDGTSQNHLTERQEEKPQNFGLDVAAGAEAESGETGEMNTLLKQGSSSLDQPQFKSRRDRVNQIEDDEEEEEDDPNVSVRRPKSKDVAKFDGYASRRDRNYDDDQSQLSDAESYVQTEVGAEMQYVNTQGEKVSNKPNPRFKNYSEVFKNLVKSTNVVTMYPICSMIITYDSTKAVTVTKRNDREYYVKQYDLEHYGLTFEEKIGGGPNQYIKLKEVEQSSDGKKYAIVYNDDGKFFLRTFGKETRTEEEIQKDELNINELLGLNDHVMCIQTFPDPFITCTFITDDKIFINLFHNATLTHYHFIYDTKARAVVGSIQERKLECTRKNFPYKCFYNDERNEIYSFYRQGQALIIDADDSSKYSLERMTEMDLGQMFLVYNSALIARSSSDILFFKIVKDEETGERKWEMYKVIEVRGFIYYIKGNVRIQITTDDKIYFYLIDKETYEPKLENVMFNYMQCNQMMFGSKVRYGVTYKTNQRSFDIYRRRYWHDFKVPISNENLEGSLGVEINSMNSFLVSKIDKVTIHDSDTFEPVDTLPIQLLKADTREPNQVIAIQKSKDEQYLAIISGKILIMNEQKTNQLFIFKRKKGAGKNGRDSFEQIHRVVLKEIPEFTQVCMQYHFKDYPEGAEPDTLIFSKRDQIFQLNFQTSAITTLYKFKTSLNRQPLFFRPNIEQNVFVIASPEDAVHVCTVTQNETDIDSLVGIASIKEIIYDSEDRKFFILANKFDEKLGFFVIKLSETNPKDNRFLIKWKNKLDIGDPNMFVLRNNEKGYKELIISYKTIFINTYNIICMDISVESDMLILFRHESFQLWESECVGILLNKNKDFITLNKQGMQVLSLGSAEKRPIKDAQGFDRMIHSLESYNFLKVDPNNYLLFECAKPEARYISVQQEYLKGENLNKEESAAGNEEAGFWNLLNVKIHEITLRELLLF